MSLIIPNKHMNSEVINFTITEQVDASKKTFKINISDTKNYALLINPSVEFNINNKTYIGTIFVGKVRTKSTEIQHYLNIENHDGFAVNDNGYFNINYKTRLMNETITEQDLINKLAYINDDSVDNFDGIEPMKLSSLFELSLSGEYVKSNQFNFDNIIDLNTHIELINGVGKFDIKSTDTDSKTINLMFEVSYVNKIFTVTKSNINNKYYGAVCFEFVVDNDNNLFIKRMGILSNSPLSLPTNIKYYLEKFTKFSNINYNDNQIARRLETSNLKPILYNNLQNYTHIFNADVLTIGDNFVHHINNNGISITNELLPNNTLNFNDLIFCDTFNSDGLKAPITYVNKPSNVPDDIWRLTNEYLFNLTTNKFHLIQRLFTKNDTLYRVKINGDANFSDWKTSLNREILASEIVTDSNHLFVTQNDINRWNNFVSNTTWLQPVNTSIDLNTIDVENGSICYVINEAKLYKFNGQEWVDLYNNADENNDGILTKEDYIRFTALASVKPFLHKLTDNKNIYTVEQSNTIYDTITDIICGIIQSTPIQSVSNNSVLFGFSNNNKPVIDSLSENSVSIGLNNQTINSKNSSNIGNNNTIENCENGVVNGSGLTANQLTNVAVGKFNLGQQYFEVGNGNSTTKSNLFGVSINGEFQLNAGLKSPSFNTYIDEDTGEIKPRSLRYTTYTIDGLVHDFNPIFKDNVEMVGDKLTFYNLETIENPDYEVDNDGNPIDPNIPQYIKEVAKEISMVDKLTYENNELKYTINDTTKLNVALSQLYSKSYNGLTTNQRIDLSTVVGKTSIENNSVIDLVFNGTAGALGFQLYSDIPLKDGDSIVVRIFLTTTYLNNTKFITTFTHNIPNTTPKFINPNELNYEVYGDFATILITRKGSSVYYKTANGNFTE